jgi:hypothetical protein
MTLENYMGNITDNMPKLVQMGKVPISTSALMNLILNTVNSTPRSDLALSQVEYLESWGCLGDAVLSSPKDKNKFKISLNYSLIRTLNPQSELFNGAIVLPNEIYEQAEGEEIKSNKVKWSQRLTKKEVLASPVWRALTQGDSYLLSNYFDLITRLMSEANNPDHIAMGIFSGTSEKNKTLMRPVFTYGWTYGSNISLNNSLSLPPHRSNLLAINSEQLTELESKIYIVEKKRL